MFLLSCMTSQIFNWSMRLMWFAGFGWSVLMFVSSNIHVTSGCCKFISLRAYFIVLRMLAREQPCCMTA